MWSSTVNNYGFLYFNDSILSMYQLSNINNYGVMNVTGKYNITISVIPTDFDAEQISYLNNYGILNINVGASNM